MPVIRFALASRIIGRFQRRGAPRRVSEVLLRRHRTLSMRRVFNVGVAVHLHRRGVSTRVHTVEHRAARPAAAMPIVLRRQAAAATSAGAARVVDDPVSRRVFAREVRREALTRDYRSTIVRDTSAPAAASAPAVPDPARPVEFVLRRTAPAIEQDERRRRAPDVRTDVFARAQTSPGDRQPAAPTIPLSPTELARLTDDVVQAIDRRFIAHRERRGIV